MPFIITNGKAYCHKTRTQAVEIVDDTASATRFSSRSTAEKLLARATKKLKGFTVEELQDTVSKKPLPADETDKNDTRSKRSSRSRTRKRAAEEKMEAVQSSGTESSPDEASTTESVPEITEKKPEAKESLTTENTSAGSAKTTSEKKPSRRGRKPAAKKTSSSAPQTADEPKAEPALQTADEPKTEPAPKTADERKTEPAPKAADERKTEPAPKIADVPKKTEQSASAERPRKVKTFLNVQDASASLWGDVKTQQPLSRKEPENTIPEPAERPEKNSVSTPAREPERSSVSESVKGPERSSVSESVKGPEKSSALEPSVPEIPVTQTRQADAGSRKRNNGNRRRKNTQAASSVPVAAPEPSAETVPAELPPSAEDIVFQPASRKKPEQSQHRTGQINGTGKVRTNRRKIGKVAENIRSVKNTEDTSSKRRFFTTKERNLIYNRSEGHCGICGRFIPLEEYTIDHIIPLSKGGTNDLDNLQACCGFCNKAKDDSMGDDFFTRIERIFLYQAKLRYGKKQYKTLKKTIKELEAEE